MVFDVEIEIQWRAMRGLAGASRTPLAPHVGFERVAHKHKLTGTISKRDQANCMGCLSACQFSNWAQNETGTVSDLPFTFPVQCTATGGGPDYRCTANGTGATLNEHDAAIDRAQAQKLAELAHDGLARAIRPAHTMFDGDVAFVLGTGPAGSADPARFLALAEASDEAIREAVERSVRR